jgi:hypothetical protein
MVKYSCCLLYPSKLGQRFGTNMGDMEKRNESKCYVLWVYVVGAGELYVHCSPVSSVETKVLWVS